MPYFIIIFLQYESAESYSHKCIAINKHSWSKNEQWIKGELISYGLFVIKGKNDWIIWSPFICFLSLIFFNIIILQAFDDTVRFNRQFNADREIEMEDGEWIDC